MYLLMKTLFLSVLYGLVFYERKQYLDAFIHFKRFYDLNNDSVDDLIPRIETAFKIERYDIAKN